MPSSDFAIPSKRAFPIEGAAHAWNGLARIAQNGMAAEVARTVSWTAQRYRSLHLVHQGVGGESRCQLAVVERAKVNVCAATP
jgi:hypothetical protein